MEENQKYLKASKWVPLIWAVLGVLCCGFALLYQTQEGKDKTDLLFFLLGAMITLLGVVVLMQLQKILETVLAPKADTKPEEDEVEGL